SVETAKGEAKDRTLSAKDLTALGRILNNRQNEMPAAVAALRVIALTGLRREEVCGLRWRELDEVGQCLRLGGTKTGRSTRPIGMAALNLLRAQPREDGVEWVFPRADWRASAAVSKLFARLFCCVRMCEASYSYIGRT